MGTPNLNVHDESRIRGKEAAVMHIAEDTWSYRSALPCANVSTPLSRVMLLHLRYHFRSRFPRGRASERFGWSCQTRKRNQGCHSHLVFSCFFWSLLLTLRASNFSKRGDPRVSRELHTYIRTWLVCPAFDTRSRWSRLVSYLYLIHCCAIQLLLSIKHATQIRSRVSLSTLCFLIDRSCLATRILTCFH